MTTLLKIDGAFDNKEKKIIEATIKEINQKWSTHDVNIEVKISMVEDGYKAAVAIDTHNSSINKSIELKNIKSLKKNLIDSIEETFRTHNTKLKTNYTSETLPINLNYYAHVLKQKEL